MSVAAVAWALKQPISDTTTKLILVALADFADDENSCWPFQETVAEIAGNCSVDTVQRHVKKLEAEGYLRREKRYSSNGNRTSDRYILAAPELSRNLRPSRQRTKPQSAAQTTPQAVAAQSKPHSCAAYNNRTTKDEPPKVNQNPPLVPLVPAEKKPDRVPYDERVQIRDDGKLIVADEFRDEWLPAFDNDPELFRLAVIEATPWVTRNSRHPESQLSGQLARQVRDRKEREQRDRQREARAEERRRRDDPFYGRADI